MQTLGIAIRGSEGGEDHGKWKARKNGARLLLREMARVGRGRRSQRCAEHAPGIRKSLKSTLPEPHHRLTANKAGALAAELWA